MTDTPMRERIVETQSRTMVDGLAEFEIHIGPVVVDYLSKAVFDAALEVMMEPDSKLVFAGANTVDNGSGDLHRRKWRSMLTTLKKDTP